MSNGCWIVLWPIAVPITSISILRDRGVFCAESSGFERMLPRRSRRGLQADHPEHRPDHAIAEHDKRKPPEIGGPKGASVDGSPRIRRPIWTTPRPRPEPR